MKELNSDRIEKNIDAAFERKDTISIELIATPLSFDFKKRHKLKFEKTDCEYHDVPIKMIKTYSTEDGAFKHEKDCTLKDAVLEAAKVIAKESSKYIVELKLVYEEKGFEKILWIKDPAAYDKFYWENEHKICSYSKRILFPGFERYNNGIEFMLDSDLTSEVRIACNKLFSG